MAMYHRCEGPECKNSTAADVSACRRRGVPVLCLTCQAKRRKAEGHAPMSGWL